MSKIPPIIVYDLVPPKMNTQLWPGSPSSLNKYYGKWSVAIEFFLDKFKRKTFFVFDVDEKRKLGKCLEGQNQNFWAGSVFTYPRFCKVKKSWRYSWVPFHAPQGFKQGKSGTPWHAESLIITYWWRILPNLINFIAKLTIQWILLLLFALARYLSNI